MSDPWQILRDGGLPLAIAGAGTRPDARTLATAARAAISLGPEGRDAEGLAAWLIAWRDHWPSTFRACFATDGDEIAAWADNHALDPGRRIKLRRIAIENLASVL